ncbi:hypothetical protein NDR87_26235 [Nocardia sp. CDC159]|uniref:Uncharacterized protein n=1 Tax=Nocardia pulmonis TaxID=2951408 RepID=A0A9X2EAS9_9NOCA|nr:MULTISPECIES: hypothetical protein [Nocardia]MCM6774946.1 hypothetical protein [Nocardia pulmonis]MCM6789877.1 hypothetical protein [Nocardia sp. CDC159]
MINTTATDTATPLVFLDTETTHLNPRLRRPWEIAMIRRPALAGQPTDRLTILIDDVDLADADPRSLQIGRFDDRHPRHSGRDQLWSPSPTGRGVALHGAPDTLLMPERDAAATVEEWTRGAVLIGIVPDFDAHTLDPMLRRHGLLPRWHYQVIDVETQAAGWLAGRLHAGDRRLTSPAWPDDDEPGRSLAELLAELLAALTPPRNSDLLSLMCDVAPPAEAERHTAMGDTAWVERWWDAISPTSTPAAGSRA